METETAALMGKFVGVAIACFLGPFLGALISRRFASNTAGVFAGTIVGGGILIAVNFLFVVVL